MTFYTNLRDNAVSALLVQFGRSITLRKMVDSYNPALGRNTQTPSDTPVYGATLPVRRVGSAMTPEFSEEQIAHFEQVVLLSAKEPAEAGVSPAVDDLLVYDGRAHRIVALAAIAPAGTAVAYKVGVAGAQG